MTASQPQFLEIGEGAARRRIACLVDAGAAPGMFWLSGFKSEMTSTKASALAAWCADRGLACTRFDYSGHGQSGGRFEDGTIGRWLEEALAVFTALTRGPQIVIGSSMGGYIALLLLRALMARAPAEAERVGALTLIAPAWDMTEELMWRQFPPEARRTIAEQGVWLEPSQYGEPYPIARGLIEEGRNHLFARRPWNPGRPIHIIHGRLDLDVPWQHTQDLIGFLEGSHTTVTTVADGEHRLSRPQDLSLLFGVLRDQIESFRS